MTQVLLLGLAGSVLGVVLAAGVVAAVPAFVGDLADAAAGRLRADARPRCAGDGGRAARVGAVLGGAAARGAARQAVAAAAAATCRAPARIDWLKWGVTAGVAAALVGVAAWQAGSLSVGLLLSGGFVAIAVVLHLAGVALVRAVQPLRYARSFALRQAVLHIARPGNQTRVILLAVGLGAFFILGVRALQANLLRDFAVQAGPNAPGHVPDRHPAGPARPGGGVARRRPTATAPRAAS